MEFEKELGVQRAHHAEVVSQGFVYCGVIWTWQMPSIWVDMTWAEPT